MLTRRAVALALALAALTVFSAEAAATVPSLLTVGHDRMHPTATFAAPGATDVTVYISTSPDRATDGSFLTENSAGIDFFTDGEIATGQWMDADTIKPGTYWVMLHATQAGCYEDEGSVCMRGYSSPLQLTVPKPKTKFTTKFEGGYIASFTLTATPLGESMPYRLCWARTGKSRKCERGTLLGTDWSDSTSDPIFLTVDDLKLGSRQKKVKFTWYVENKRVASRTIRVGS